MATNKLIFNSEYKFEFATNLFINVPIILKYNDINLIEVVRDTVVKYTTKIPIFHSDGTHLAYATGNRIFKTDEGKKAGILIDEYPGLWVCKMDGKTIFEIKQKGPDFFKTTAELFTNDGYFIKVDDSISYNTWKNNEPLRINGATIGYNTIQGGSVGIFIGKDGSIGIGG